ncbi:sensor histidine kinase [Virgisporangium aurantiacum]|uniref:histidine kinase n=1 Tax=Virgisporangium aurantiacum TaxID=175570 RepID=A0A8J3ZAP1_9ACTN|nr:sensor histidine kinase [Virgisporangium aurantiacum]GIJ60481.1 histidine kinase [Virgisporangium aurantiacum]
MFVLAPFRGLALVALAAVGFVLGAVQLAAACLVGPYNVTVEVTRHVVNLARTLAGRWSGVPVAVPYRPPPPRPTPRADGLYEHDGSLYKHAGMPNFLRRAGWLATDPATSRDWFWLIVNLPAGGALAALPAGLVVGGLAVATGVVGSGLPAWAAVVVGVAAAALGVAIGPAVLRLHGWFTWLLLRPADKAAWREFAFVKWFRRTHAAVWQGGGIVGISFGALGIALWHLLIAWCTGTFGLAWSVPVGRHLTNVYRRLAGEWAGVPIDVPYRPQQLRLEVEADGRYKVGRWLVDNRASALRHLRWDWVMRDRATWRDIAWAVTAPFVSLPLLVPVLLVMFGIYGLAWQPVVWPLWGVPILLFGGPFVTPWYMWYVLVYFSDVFDMLPAWTSPLVGLAIGAVGLLLGPPLVRMHARFSRLLLGPTEAARLAQRVAHLTETRSDAVDAQAAELRRIERDLHDGAQSRMIAVGLSLGAIEQLIDKDPDAARELLRQARATSATALADLRDLVRGIHPPVLSERGLADAVRAIALDTPLPVRVTVDPEVDTGGRLPAPVESAAYFAVIEALANAARHSGAGEISVSIGYSGRALWMRVADDGRGGADPANGTGLAGIRRRLGTFDGTLDVSSPAGGPTVVAMTLPCPPPGSPDQPTGDVFDG